MLLAAIAVGLLTAYYFGLRPGMVAAGATAALFVVAFVVPSVAIWAYGAVGVGVLGLLWAGPRMKRQGTPSQYALFARMATGRLKRAVGAFLGGGERKSDKQQRRR